MSAYPPALRSILKAAPCLIMCLAACTVTYVYLHGTVRHSQDHVPKATYRSTKFERALRMRDQKVRRQYDYLINLNPNLL